MYRIWDQTYSNLDTEAEGLRAVRTYVHWHLGKVFNPVTEWMAVLPRIRGWSRCQECHNFLKHKYDLVNVLDSYNAFLKNERNYKMERIWLDKVAEHLSRVIKGYKDRQGITLDFSPAHGSQSNGSSERLNKELWKMA